MREAIDETRRELAADIIAELGVVRLDSPSPLADLAPQLEVLLEADSTFTYRPVLSAHGWTFEWLTASGACSLLVDDISSTWNANATSEVAFYSPARPEPAQRNRVLHPRDLVSEKTYTESPTYDLFVKAGIAEHDQLRVLLCDGPIQVGWMGGFRAQRFGPAEHELLTELTRPVLRRIQVERILMDHARGLHGLEVVLEALPRAAAIVSADGRVEHANSAFFGLHPQPEEAMRSVARALAGEPNRWRAQPLETAGAPRFFLVVQRPADAARERALVAARAWRLTPRQTEVLERIVRGRANKEIAVELGCAVRTVELHVAAVLKKASCDRRIEVIVRVLAHDFD